MDFIDSLSCERSRRLDPIAEAQSDYDTTNFFDGALTPLPESRKSKKEFAKVASAIMKASRFPSVVNPENTETDMLHYWRVYNKWRYSVHDRGQLSTPRKMKPSDFDSCTYPPRGIEELYRSWMNSPEDMIPNCHPHSLEVLICKEPLLPPVQPLTTGKPVDEPVQHPYDDSWIIADTNDEPILTVDPVEEPIEIDEDDECWEPIGDGLYVKFNPMERSKNKRTTVPTTRIAKIRRRLFAHVGAEREEAERRVFGQFVIDCTPPTSPPSEPEPDLESSE